MNIKEKARQLKTEIPAIYLALKTKETPFLAKALAFVTIVYALSPIDLVPDFIPLFGYLDDVIILPFLVLLTMKFIPKQIWERSKKEAEDLWQNGRPKKWYYALPIIMVWMIVIWIIIKKVFMQC